ncbi:MAG: YraN family protein [Rhodospirillales bacterium]|jgi:putative endonuclease|nr:YraN family protein [Rhodospirillales bacterium]HJO73333.1 YraN family protein [Rhodospirillales bacterium]
MIRPDAVRKKRRAWAFSRLTEEFCSWHLRPRGYRILARRFRAPVGEINIVARRGRTLAIVEVKAHERRDDDAQALNARQRRRIVRAAEAFLRQRPRCDGLDVCFDLMVVVPRRLPVHTRNAWRTTP